MSEQDTQVPSEQRTTESIYHLLENPLVKEQIDRAIESYGTIREIAALRRQEQTIISMLRQLPIALIITRREDTRYVWQWVETMGTASNFVEALQNALIHIEGAGSEVNEL